MEKLLDGLSYFWAALAVAGFIWFTWKFPWATFVVISTLAVWVGFIFILGFYQSLGWQYRREVAEKYSKLEDEDGSD